MPEIVLDSVVILATVEMRGQSSMVAVDVEKNVVELVVEIVVVVEIEDVAVAVVVVAD